MLTGTVDDDDDRMNSIFLCQRQGVKKKKTMGRERKN